MERDWNRGGEGRRAGEKEPQMKLDRQNGESQKATRGRKKKEPEKRGGGSWQPHPSESLSPTESIKLLADPSLPQNTIRGTTDSNLKNALLLVCGYVCQRETNKEITHIENACLNNDRMNFLF